MEATKLSVKCKECGTKYSIPESYQGSKIQCRRCGKFIFLQTRRPSATRRVASSDPTSTADRSHKLPVIPLLAVLASLVAIALGFFLVIR